MWGWEGVDVCLCEREELMYSSELSECVCACVRAVMLLDSLSRGEPQALCLILDMNAVRLTACSLEIVLIFLSCL